jgi:hypothetical protein
MLYRVGDVQPFDASYHSPSSAAARGECSQHGVDTCAEPPVISFRDKHNRRQSGCVRAAHELLARGEIPHAPWLNSIQ